MRMPKNEHALQMIEELGCPVATTSANISGQKATKSFAEITSELLEQVGFAFNDDDLKSWYCLNHCRLYGGARLSWFAKAQLR